MTETNSRRANSDDCVGGTHCATVLFLWREAKLKRTSRLCPLVARLMNQTHRQRSLYVFLVLRSVSLESLPAYPERMRTFRRPQPDHRRLWRYPATDLPVTLSSHFRTEPRSVPSPNHDNPDTARSLIDERRHDNRERLSSFAVRRGRSHRFDFR